MSRHVTYRGITLDMDGIRRENEKVTAIGNMGVNARGDKIEDGLVTKTADEMARENHRIQSIVYNTSLKGPQPEAETPVLESGDSVPAKTARGPKIEKEKVKKTREVELESGDIVVKEDND